MINDTNKIMKSNQIKSLIRELTQVLLLPADPMNIGNTSRTTAARNTIELFMIEMTK